MYFIVHSGNSCFFSFMYDTRCYQRPSQAGRVQSLPQSLNWTNCLLKSTIIYQVTFKEQIMLRFFFQSPVALWHTFEWTWSTFSWHPLPTSTCTLRFMNLQIVLQTTFELTFVDAVVDTLWLYYKKKSAIHEPNAGKWRTVKLTQTNKEKKVIILFFHYLKGTSTLCPCTAFQQAYCWGQTRWECWKGKWNSTFTISTVSFCRHDYS